MMREALTSPEDVYTDESEDFAEQERRRHYDEEAARIPLNDILDTVLNEIRADDTSAFHAVIRDAQHLPYREPTRAYLPHPQALGNEFVQRVAKTIDAHVSRRLASRGG